MQKRIGFLGLGAMGKPMATRLVQAGYEVIICALALDVSLPIAELAYRLFTQAKELGYGRQDMTAISKLYQQAANVNIVAGQPFQAEGIF